MQVQTFHSDVLADAAWLVLFGVQGKVEIKACSGWPVKLTTER